MTTLADALGPMARPLARVLAHWRLGDRWRVRIIRRVYPSLARQLDQLAEGYRTVVGPE